MQGVCVYVSEIVLKEPRKKYGRSTAEGAKMSLFSAIFAPVHYILTSRASFA